MSRISKVALGVALVSSLALASLARAASSPVGDWVRKSGPDKAPPMTFTIEKWGKKAKLIWHLPQAMTMTLVSDLDGKDAPVIIDGKVSGETMAIKLVDEFRSTNVLKMNGQPFGTSKATFSGDFNTLTVESTYTTSVGGNVAGKTTEVWVRK